MSTIHEATELRQTAILAGRISSFFKTCRDALGERCRRQLLRERVSDLSDRELLDIGITRGELDYVASNRAIGLRGIRSPEWI
jgi:uncharacterized protein YjiS (DUF1127 family)